MKKLASAAMLSTLLVGCANYNDYKGWENDRGHTCNPNFKLWRACAYSFNFSQKIMQPMTYTHPNGTKQEYRPVVWIDEVYCNCDNNTPDYVEFTVKAAVSHGMPKGTMPNTLRVPFYIVAGDHKGDNVYDRQMFHIHFDLNDKFNSQVFKLRFDTKSLNARNIKNYTLWGGLLHTRDEVDADYDDKFSEVKELVEAPIDDKASNVRLPMPQ